MGLHIAWDGPQIYLQLGLAVAVVCGAIWALRRA